jgi:hypothetical protein
MRIVTIITLFLLSTLLLAIVPTFAADGDACTTQQGSDGYKETKNGEEICIDNCVVDGIPTLKCLESVVNNGLSLSTGFVILILFIMFVYGSFMYMTSFGEAKKAQTAQNIIKYAVIGFIVFLSSYAILNTVDKLFLGGEGKLLKFSIDEGNTKP